MPSSDDRIRDIVENIERAQAFTTGLTAEEFGRNRLVEYAVTRCLEIISEASRHLGPDIKDRHPEIRWREIAGAGNIYRHGYELVSADIVWKTVRDALPPLLDAMRAELASG